MTRLRQLLDAISLLPDSEDHPEMRADLLAEIDCDVEYRRRMSRHRLRRGWRPEIADNDDDEYQPPAVVDQRRAEVRRRRRIDWLAWFRTITFRSDPDCPRDRVYMIGEDAIEMRMRSYANVIRPGWNAFFTVD